MSRPYPYQRTAIKTWFIVHKKAGGSEEPPAFIEELTTTTYSGLRRAWFDMNDLIAADHFEVDQEQQINPGHDGWHKSIGPQRASIAGDTRVVHGPFRRREHIIGGGGIAAGLVHCFTRCGQLLIHCAELRAVESMGFLENQEFARRG